MTISPNPINSLNYRKLAEDYFNCTETIILPAHFKPYNCYESTYEYTLSDEWFFEMNPHFYVSPEMKEQVTMFLLIVAAHLEQL